MGLLDRGQAALNRRQKQAAGRVVTYSRGTEAVTLTAWIGSTAYTRTTDDPGASVVWSDRDYLFAAADLRIGGRQVTPEKDDRITEVVDGAEVVFEVSTAPGEPPYRFSDQTRTTYRVHTKRKTKAT